MSISASRAACRSPSSVSSGIVSDIQPPASLYPISLRARIIICAKLLTSGAKLTAVKGVGPQGGPVIFRKPSDDSQFAEHRLTIDLHKRFRSVGGFVNSGR